MSEFFEDMIDAAEELSSVDTEGTKTLSGVVRQLEGVLSEVDQAEAHLKRLKQERLRLSQDVIPSLMEEMDVNRIDVGEGEHKVSVSIKPFISASIPVENKERAYEWLRDHNCDDIIKNDVILSFGRREDDQASKLMLELENKGYHPEAKTHIHSQTLKAFIRERVENGKPIDLELFGAFVGKTAEIKRK